MRGAIERLGQGARIMQPTVYHAFEVWRTPAGHTLPRQTMAALERRGLLRRRQDRAELSPAAQRLIPTPSE
jgi:hypothetical protein